MIEVTEQPVEPGEIYERLRLDGAGSVAIHFAVVKPKVEGRPTRGIRFAIEGAIESEMRDLEAKLHEKWDITDVLLVRRMGELLAGDIISVAAISAPGREAAFEACAMAVEQFKKMRRLRKEELIDEI